MKYLRQYLILGIFVLLTSFHGLRAMRNVTQYDETKTEELKQYLNELIRIFEQTKNKPNKIELSKKIYELVEQGADPNIRTNYNSSSSMPIHFAAEAGDVALIKFLISHGADIEARNSFGRTPLSFAAQNGHIEAIVQLMSLGANIETDYNGWTPLMFAVHNAHQEAAIVLIGLGANANRISRLEFPPNSIFCTYFKDGKILQEEPELHKAVRLGDDSNEVKRILSDSAKDSPKTCINQLDVHKQTAFDIALVTRNNTAILLLLSFGANPLRGLYNGVRLARGVKEWQQRSIEGQKTLYEQILAVPLKHCWAIFLACDQNELPKEIGIYIIQIMLSCKNPSSIKIS